MAMHSDVNMGLMMKYPQASYRFTVITTSSVYLCLSTDDGAARGQQELEVQPVQSGGRSQAGPGKKQQLGEGHTVNVNSC